MSFQAYLDSIKTKTGKGPDDFKRLAEQKGFLQKGQIKVGTKAGDIIYPDMIHEQATTIYTRRR